MSNINLSGISNAHIFRIRRRWMRAGQAGGTGFGDVLKDAVSTVNQSNDSAATQVASLLHGAGGDINNVMIAVEKADVSFELMMQVRNKIVSAYQDIEKMQF